MSVASKEREWANRARRFVKAELKRAEVSYAELARRLGEHGLARLIHEGADFGVAEVA